MDITQNYFEIFGIDQAYRVDTERLSERYRELQRSVHPDRYADRSEREQRLAMQWATHINEGLETLKSPVRRAEYLLSLAGVESDTQSQTTSDGVFLMQQMELREELADVAEQDDPEAALDKLSEHVAELLQQLEAEFEASYGKNDLKQAATVVEKLHFITKLEVEVEQLESRLLDY